MIRGQRSYACELRFDAEFAETIADTHWHDTQEVLWQEDGSILFRCKVDGLEEIVWWVLSMGPHCSVRKPRELAARTRQLAAAMLALYPQENADGPDAERGGAAAADRGHKASARKGKGKGEGKMPDVARP